MTETGSGGGTAGAPDEERSECQRAGQQPASLKRRQSIACLRPLTRLIARSLIPISRGVSDPFSSLRAFYLSLPLSRARARAFRHRLGPVFGGWLPRYSRPIGD